MKNHFLSGKGIISFPTQKNGLFDWAPDQTYLVRRTLWSAGQADFDENGLQRSTAGWYRNGPMPLRLPGGKLFVPPGWEVVAVFDQSKLAIFTGITLTVECADKDDVKIELAVKLAANTNDVRAMITLLYGLQHTTVEEFFGVEAKDCLRPWTQLLTAEQLRVMQDGVSSRANKGWKKKGETGYRPSFKERMVRMGFKRTTKLDIVAVHAVRRVEIEDAAQREHAVARAKTSGAGEGIATAIKDVAGDPGVQALVTAIAGAFGNKDNGKGSGGGTP